MDNALRTARKALGRADGSTDPPPLPDPFQILFRWLDGLPNRIALSERTVKGRERIATRVRKPTA